MFFDCHDVYHKLPDSGELQYNSRTRKRRFEPALRAGGRVNVEATGGAAGKSTLPKVDDPLLLLLFFITLKPRIE